MVCISVDSLFKKMNDRVLFQDVTFSIQEQEKVALIGTNGSGKSTLLKILAQEETIDGGRILTKNGLKVHLLRQNPVFNANDKFGKKSFNIRNNVLRIK